MKASIRNRVANATVKLPRLKGQGVIVTGNLILTAAHCIGWDSTMFLDGHCFETVQCGCRKIRAAILAVEPVADVAVLGCPDDQYDPEGAAGFDDLMNAVEPVEICTDDFELFAKIPAHVLAHTGRWIDDAFVQLCSPDARNIWVESQTPIKGGTSGGPIVISDGRLVGVVSQSSEGLRPATGIAPRPHLCLPAWVLVLMKDADAPTQ